MDAAARGASGTAIPAPTAATDAPPPATPPTPPSTPATPAALAADTPPAAWNLEDSARLLAIAGVLGTLTVLIYRLGIWRQEMENTKNNVGAEVKAHREESTANFDRLERRLEAIDHMVAASVEDRARSDRRHARTERRLDRLERMQFDDPRKDG